VQDPTLLADLLALVEPDARGDPMLLLRWTSKSLSQLMRALEHDQSSWSDLVL